LASLHRGEFLISRALYPATYKAAGLSYETKLDLNQIVDLPFSTQWFSVPPAASHGQVPTLGTLHPSMVRAVEAAYRAVCTTK
jgi:hypothetical protein